MRTKVQKKTDMCKKTLFFLEKIEKYLHMCKKKCNFVSDFVGRVFSGGILDNNQTKVIVMENRRYEDKKEPEIVYSRSVKAGKRIYYLDVKKARNEDLYLCITESKKKSGFEDEAPQFEKHKVFLYKEDFAHFTEGLQDVINYVTAQMGGTIEARQEWHPEVEASPEADAPASEVQEEPKKKGLLGRILG